jgi:branched-chain amino acid transport system permease protein
METFGRDEWVAQIEARQRRRGRLAAAWARVPPWARLLGFVALAAAVPHATESDYIIRIAGNFLLYGALALGLNVVVGYAGLLDLGYVAFYGLGGYTYALLSSPQFNVHWPAGATLLVVVVLSLFFGLLLGSPSLRLVGDYLAIVTLGFGQIFVQLATSFDRVRLPGLDRPVNITGGPNGIVNVDPLTVFGFPLRTVTHHYYLLLVLLVLVLVGIYHLNHSRIGRAWRAMREDALAAEVMGMPTKRLKLLAFALGAMIAGSFGGVFAAWQGSVFPSNFDVTLLILLYAMVILGGLGSLPGVLVGAFILSVVPELLREIEISRYLFYGGGLFLLLTLLRPRQHLFWALVGAVGGGYVLKLGAVALWPAVITTPAVSATLLGRAVQAWLIIPPNATLVGNLAFGLVVLLLLFLTRTRRALARLIALIPTLYLLAFVWETRLAIEPSVTRLILLGALLVALMTYRPEGLFGQRRVEIV